MSSVRVLALVCGVALVGVSGCSQQQGGGQPPPKAQPQAQAGTSGPLGLDAVNGAQLQAQPATTQPAGPGGNTTGGNTTGAGAGAASKTPDPVLIKAEVLLDRAKFSPGVIDGLDGENFQNALKAYEAAHNLPATGQLDPQVWAALTADKAPVLAAYIITQQDVAGPWSPDVGEDMVKLSDEKATGYHSPLELLAEKFHMDQDLLKALNPNADFGKAGTRIVAASPGPSAVSGEVKRIEVDKAKEQVRAYDANNRLLALYPATVGSTERPSPVGTYHVTGVSKNPDYIYDPSKLTWGPKSAGKLHIPPGPNNPVGLVWIALSAPDYGIHGSPDPKLIGKTASHGCVRLTNWDAVELGSAVKPGVQVVFLGGSSPKSRSVSKSSIVPSKERGADSADDSGPGNSTGDGDGAGGRLPPPAPGQAALS